MKTLRLITLASVAFTMTVSAYVFAGPNMHLRSGAISAPPADSISETVNPFPHSKIHIVRYTKFNKHTASVKFHSTNKYHASKNNRKKKQQTGHK